MEATIYVQDSTGPYPDWYMNTTAPVALTINYYLIYEATTYSTVADIISDKL